MTGRRIFWQVFFLTGLLVVMAVFPFGLFAQPPLPSPLTAGHVSISGVDAKNRLFNPSRGETATIFYQVSLPAKVSIKIFDPQMSLIRELLTENPGTADQVVWDGRDQEGNIVPDEAYFFTVEATDYAGNFTFFDPTTFSGGDTYPPEVTYDPGKQVVACKLESDARVKIRAGISAGGPLLKNILSRVPKLAGFHELAWDGKDESGVIEVVSQKGYALMAEAVSLPENSFITVGNTAYDYTQYKYDIARPRPKKLDRPRPQNKLFPLTQQRAGIIEACPEPKLILELPQNPPTAENPPPVVQGKVPIRIHLDDKIKKYITEQRYELLFFVDFRFVSEMEEGHSPVNWVWDTGQVPNGEHIISVNVATLTGQVGCVNLKLIVHK